MKPVSTKALFLSIATGVVLAMGAGTAAAAGGDTSFRTAPLGAETAQYRPRQETAPRYRDQYRGQYRGRAVSVASRGHVMRVLRQNGFVRVQNLRLVTANSPRGYRGPARQYYLATGWRRGGHYRITADSRTGQPTQATRIATRRHGYR